MERDCEVSSIGYPAISRPEWLAIQCAPEPGLGHPLDAHRIDAAFA